MNNADGKIIINTEINTSNFEKKVKSMEKRLDELSEKARKPYEIDGVKVTGGFNLSDEELQEYEKLSNELEKLREERRQSLNIEENITKEIQKQSQEKKKNVISPLEVDKEFQLYNELESLIEEYNNIKKTPIIDSRDVIKAEQIRQDIILITKDLEKLTGRSFQIRGITDVSNNIKDTKNNLKGVSKGITDVISKVGKWALAVFGVRSAYLFVRQAMGTISQYNKQLATDLQYIKFAIATIIEPLVTKIINVVYKLLNLINQISIALFNYNLFTRATADNFKKINSSANSLRKTLMGFDELNVLNDNGTSGILSPSVDLSNVTESVNSWTDNINIGGILKKFGKKMLELNAKIRKVIQNIDWVKIGEKIGELISEIDWNAVLNAFIQSFTLAISILPKILWGIIKQRLTELWKKAKIDAEENGGNTGIAFVLGLIGGILKKMFPFHTLVWENIIKPKLNELKEKISNSGENAGFSFILSLIGGILKKMFPFHTLVWDNLLKPAFNKLLPNFSKEGSNAGENFVSAFISAMPLWKFTNHISKIVSEIKKMFGFNINVNVNPSGFTNGGGGRVFAKGGIVSPLKITKLASGAIINQPGRGIPVNRAIAGERGAEGIVPLTDSQQMELLGSAIGRYITLNLTNITDLNGRQIAREIKRINVENDFAYNR